MASLFGLRSPTNDERTEDADESTLAESPLSPQSEDDTPLTESQEAQPGTETSCMHFMVKSKLGWIAWKEMEGTLYSIFERGFAATRCEMKFSESLEEFGFEVEVPNDEVEKFKKFFKGKALAQEIDMLHGIDPLCTKYRDAKLANLKKTMGTTLKETDVRSSIEVLKNRFKALEQVGQGREREVRAIQEQFASLQSTMLQKFDDLQKRFQSKIEGAVWKKMQNVDKEIRDSVAEDLAVLNLDPLAREGAKQAAAAPAEDPKLRERADAAEQKLSEMQADRDTLREGLDEANRRLVEVQDERDKLQERITSLETKMGELEADRNVFREGLNAANAELAELRATRDALRLQLAEAQEEIRRESEKARETQEEIKRQEGRAMEGHEEIKSGSEIVKDLPPKDITHVDPIPDTLDGGDDVLKKQTEFEGGDDAVKIQTEDQG